MASQLARVEGSELLCLAYKWNRTSYLGRAWWSLSDPEPSFLFLVSPHSVHAKRGWKLSLTPCPLVSIVISDTVLSDTDEAPIEKKSVPSGTYFPSI
jgi:hypothetical protein